MHLLGLQNINRPAQPANTAFGTRAECDESSGDALKIPGASVPRRVRLRWTSGREFQREQLRSRDCGLDHEIDADTGDRRHRMLKTQAQKSPGRCRGF
jgi:hypothetical protein